MSILFDFYETPDPSGKEEGKRYHARPVLSSTVRTEEVAALIQDRSSLTKGDVLSALSGLAQVLSEKLQNGQRVQLDGIGCFHITLSCSDVRTKKDMRANKVGVKAVTFRADKHLKSDLRKTKARRTHLKLHSVRLSVEEIDAKLVEHFKENQILTRRGFQSVVMMTRITAIRHIHRLLEEGKLKNINSNQNPVYVPGDNFPVSGK